MAAWKKWLHSRPFEWQFRPTPAGVEEIRQKLLSILDDCHGFECDRLRWRLHMAEAAPELWLLRDQVFQAVASEHCQAQAAQRINGLVPHFEAVMPGRQLTRV